MPMKSQGQRLGTRIHHQFRERPRRRRAEINSMDIFHLSLEPLGKWIGALAEICKRASGVVAFQRHDDEISLRCMLMKRAFADTELLSVGSKIRLLGTRELTNKCLPLRHLVGWDWNCNCENRHNNPPCVGQLSEGPPTIIEHITGIHRMTGLLKLRLGQTGKHGKFESPHPVFQATACITGIPRSR